VLHRSGKREHIRGPAVLYENPVLHEAIQVKDCVQLVAPTESLIVYTEVSVGTPVDHQHDGHAQNGGGKSQIGAEEKETEPGAHVQLLTTSYAEGSHPALEKSVSRRIITGPAVFVPKVGEFMHEFEWSGNAHSCTQGSNDARGNQRVSSRRGGGGSSGLGQDLGSAVGEEPTKVVPGALKFEVLHTNRQTWAVDSEMRTSDNITFTVKLTFNYELKSVEHMLASSSDPVAEWMAGLEADICVLGDRVTSSSVMQHGLNAELSTLDSFPCLRQRMQANGFSLDQCVLRRVLASEALERRFREAAAEEAEGVRRLALAEANLKTERIAALSKAESEARKAEQKEEREAKAAEAKEKSDARAADAKETSLRLEMERVEARRLKEHEMQAAQLAHALQMAKSKEDAEAASANATLERQVRYLKELKELEVDLTAFLMNGNNCTNSAGAGAVGAGAVGAGTVGAAGGKQLLGTGLDGAGLLGATHISFPLAVGADAGGAVPPPPLP